MLHILLMKRPQTPHQLADYVLCLYVDEEIRRLPLLVSSPQGMSDEEERYLHWDKMRNLTP